MPPQHVEIAETIAALKRTLRREKEAPTNEAISSATNRGNKLKRGANYVHAGALPYPHGPEGYKEKIEHAGYSRYILNRNPKRFNESGDELDDSETDTEADEDAREANPYTGIQIEELLCPLKHPSELANHPTLSLPFLDSALPDMVRTTEEKLRQERRNLWRAKNLNREFMGDESWIPLCRTETKDDWDLFDPKPAYPVQQAGKKRKRNPENGIVHNGVNGYGHAEKLQIANGETMEEPESIEESSQPQNKIMNSVEAEQDSTSEEATKVEAAVVAGGAPTSNGVHAGHKPSSQEPTNDPSSIQEHEQKSQDEPLKEADAETDEQDTNMISDEEKPPQPTRRITRALAAEHNSTTALSPPQSPHDSTTSSVDASLLQVDPFFLLPPALAPDQRTARHLARLGLPTEELTETRRLLMMFIQKQEETVRGYEGVLGKLIKAKRMRDKVWEWCRTEGHVGEWSDGEDWIDAEAWGLAPEELKKGKDEEEVEGQEDTGRKGKRRRRD